MNPQPAVRSVGLTGGIGSGKSTVASLLERHGAFLVDTDAIARELTAVGGAALPALAEAFGPGVLAADGALDRARMRELAFGDPSQRERLQAVLHPMIGAIADQRAHAAGGRPVVFDVPLLAESARWRQRVDRVLVVDCDEDEQVRRVVARSGWAEAQVRAVMAQQATRTARRRIADAVIDNGPETSLERLASHVETLCRLWFGAPPKR